MRIIQLKFVFVLLVILFVHFVYSANPADDMELVHYRLGMRHYKAKEYDRAIEAFGKMLTFRPNHAPSLHLMGLCYSEKGDLPMAIANLRKAVRFDGDNTELLRQLSGTYARNSEIEPAMLHLRNAINKEKDAQKRILLEQEMAQLLAKVKSGTVESTVRDTLPADSKLQAPVKQIVKVPVVSDTVLSRLVKLVNDSNYQEAVKEARFLLTKHPGKTGAFFYAALARFGLKQNREALYNFKRASSDPVFAESAAYHIRLIEGAKGSTIIAKKAPAAVAKTETSLDTAAPAKVSASVTAPFSFTIAEKLNFIIEDTLQKVGRKMLAALDLYLAERPDPAINQLRGIYQAAPSSREADNALYNMGLIYAKLRLWDNASAMLEKVMKEYPRSDVALNALALSGHVEAGRGSNDSALKIYDRYLSVNQNGVGALEVFTSKGDVLFRKGDWQTARNVYTAALAISPGSVELNERIGECFWKDGNAAQSVEFLQKALSDTLSQSESSMRAAYRIGDAYFKIKNFENALRYYRQALARFPHSVDAPWALYQIGNIHRRGGQSEAAIKVYERLMAEYPSSYWASQAKWQKDDVVWESEYKEILR